MTHAVSMLDDILTHLRAYPTGEEPEITGDLLVQYDNDSFLHVLGDIPEVLGITPAILDHPGDEDFCYRAGILIIRTVPQPLFYRPLYVDAQLGWDGEGVTLDEPIVCRRVHPQPCRCNACENPAVPWLSTDNNVHTEGLCEECTDACCPHSAQATR